MRNVIPLMVILCAAAAEAAECDPPNVLLVMDRSGSMDEEIDGSGGRTKWEMARDSLTDLVLAYETRARFGIGLFPDGDPEDRCVTGSLVLGVGDSHGDEIAGILDAVERREGTPIAASLEAITDADPGLGDASRGQYVILVTDGEENCGGDPGDEVGDLRGRSPEVRTFVVGFGDGVDEEQLSEMAVAGGTARPGWPPYYQANDEAALRAALETILADIDCSGGEDGGGDADFDDGDGTGAPDAACGSDDVCGGLDGGMGGGGGGAGTGDDDGTAGSSGGCGCDVRRRASPSPAAALLILTLALAFVEARRRR